MPEILEIIIFERVFNVSSKPSLYFLKGVYFAWKQLLLKYCVNYKILFKKHFLVWITQPHLSYHPFFKLHHWTAFKGCDPVLKSPGHNSEHSLISILLMTLTHLYLKSARIVKRSQGVHKIEHFLFLKLRTKWRELSVRRPYREIINKQKQAV